MLTPPTTDKILNFIVVGEVRCGAAVVQSSISAHPQAVCHADLLDRDPKVRKQNHEAYFGPPSSSDTVEYCARPLSPELYLDGRIFDNPLRDEQAVGIKVLYRDVEANQLWEYFRNWDRVGDFCTIHITRNPVACYVSLMQARASGVFHVSVNSQDSRHSPPPLQLDLNELVQFCRWHATCECKVRAACEDRLEMTYKELFLNYHEVMAGVFDFLTLPPFSEVKPAVKRLRNRSVVDRISNFKYLRANVPGDVREYFESDDLF